MSPHLRPSHSLILRVVALLVIISMTGALTSCTVDKTVKLPPAQVGNPGNERIVGVTTTDGREISFDPPGATVHDKELSGDVDGKPVELRLDQIQRFWVVRKETSTVRTIGAVAAIAGGVIILGTAIALATKNSCPFVYSWNGEEYVFDAEPYGGAITQGLEKDDFAELQLLEPTDGLYRLLIRNEVPETQYTNLAELLVVDHPTNLRVIPDLAGRMHTVENPVPALSAVNASGKDLRPWLRETDRLIWEETPSPLPGSRLRDEIVLTFSKPAGAQRAKLVSNISTGLYGSYMIREVLRWRGDRLQAWYQQVDTTPEDARRIHEWSRWTQAYALDVEIREAEGWKRRGVLVGEGPFLSEERITILDLSGVEGDQVSVRLRPPLGFWALNSMRMDFSEDQPIRVTKVAPARVRDNQGRDRTASLSAVDEDYYPMPEIGDSAVMEFPVPDTLAGSRRTVFLHTRGYYRVHLKGTGPQRERELQQLQTDPDFLLRMAQKHLPRDEQQRVVDEPINGRSTAQKGSIKDP